MYLDNLSFAEPCSKLWFGVLCRAIEDYVYGPDPSSRGGIRGENAFEWFEAIQRSAGRWIHSTVAMDAFSFTWVCAELDMDPDWLRQEIEKRAAACAKTRAARRAKLK